MRKLKIAHPTEKILIFILVCIIGLMAAILWYFGQKIDTLWAQNGNDGPNKNSMSHEMKFYIQSAVQSLYNSQPSTDAQQQRLYLPEARIYLPLNAHSRTIVYRYEAGDKDTPEQIVLTTTANTNALPSTFNDVPCIQRNATFLINSQDGTYADGKLISSVNLADGRILYIHKKENGNCNDLIWADGDPDKIIELMMQAKSY